MAGIKLTNGVEIPKWGYGTDVTSLWMEEKGLKKMYLRTKYSIRYRMDKNWKQLNIDKNIYKILIDAPKLGCHLFDTAAGYGASEFLLGNAIAEQGKEQYFISTKLSNAAQRNSTVEEALGQSLKKLGVKQVDLFLLHWPQIGTWLDAWKQMEKMYKRGLCRSIGVCNCNIHHLDKLKEIADIMPMVNQYECHPIFQQKELEEYCRSNNIQIMAYTPTGRGDARIRDNEVLNQIAKKYDSTVIQTVLAWHMNCGRIPIVNTTSLQHLSENAEAANIKLTYDELELIGKQDLGCRLRYDPDNCDFEKL